MQHDVLRESLNVLKSLLYLLYNQSQSLQKLSAPPSKHVTSISNRESSSSPDNTTNEVTKEQTANDVGGARCDCKNIVGVADVVKAYLKLFPKLIFDTYKLNHFDQSHPKEWVGTKVTTECCQCSCDLLVDFLSSPLSSKSCSVSYPCYL